LIIQTIRRDPSRAVWADETSNVSSLNPSGADQIDVEHQATELAVRPWRVLAAAAPCGPAPGRTSRGGGRLCCRLSSVALPQGLHDAAAVAAVRRAGACGCRCPPAASTVQASGPSLSAGCADLARNPSSALRNRTPRPCPRCGRVLAGRPLSTAEGAAAPKQGEETAVAGRQPSMHTRSLRQ
jgi:hypothetical protein